MKPSEAPSPVPSYTGHVRNGVVILDGQVPLQDGQAVRVEPLAPGAAAPVAAEPSDRVQELQRLFAAWTEEDAALSDDEADQLQTELEQRRRLRFGSAEPD